MNQKRMIFPLKREKDKVLQGHRIGNIGCREELKRLFRDWEKYWALREGTESTSKLAERRVSRKWAN